MGLALEPRESPESSYEQVPRSRMAAVPGPAAGIQ